MSNDDPFAAFEPDHTFVMPSPGQRPPQAQGPGRGTEAALDRAEASDPGEPDDQGPGAD